MHPNPSIPGISVADLAAVLAADPSTPVVDVREPTSTPPATCPGGVPHAAAHGARARTTSCPATARSTSCARSGGRCGQAVAWLNAQGYDTVNVEGGTRDWVLSGYPVE